MVAKTNVYDRDMLVAFRGEVKQIDDVLHTLKDELKPIFDKQGHIGLTDYDALTAISEVNRLRCATLEGSDEWTVQDHGCALAGEVGELCDILKKLKRIDTGIVGNWPNARSKEQLIADAADEIGDVLTYLDLVAGRLGIDLLGAWASKFNRVSDKLGLAYHILLEHPHPEDVVQGEEPDLQALLKQLFRS